MKDSKRFEELHNAWMNGELPMDGAPAYTDCWNPEAGAYKPDALRKAFLAGCAARTATTFKGKETFGKVSELLNTVHNAVQEQLAGTDAEHITKPSSEWYRDLNIPNTNPTVIGRCLAELARLYPGRYLSNRTSIGVIWRAKA